ncbi:hypothetical protein D9M68_661880 [compost metagenome]
MLPAPLRQGGTHRFDTVGIDFQHHQACAQGSEAFGQVKADARPSTGDQNGLAFEIHRVHLVFLLLEAKLRTPDAVPETSGRTPEAPVLIGRRPEPPQADQAG